ncbi:hypothetical protein LA080_006452 [Diaporthe eres]|nr:hypothetical protein LA080_006452 [Diaporthe eres]
MDSITSSKRFYAILPVYYFRKSKLVVLHILRYLDSFTTSLDLEEHCQCHTEGNTRPGGAHLGTQRALWVRQGNGSLRHLNSMDYIWLFCLGAFTVAGGFSSSISSGISDEVLLNGANCGAITGSLIRLGSLAATILSEITSAVWWIAKLLVRSITAAYAEATVPTYVESLDAQYKNQPENPFRGQGNSFIINTKIATVVDGKSHDSLHNLDPIPAIFSPDADTVLIFFSGNGILFLERTNDPWYRATVPGREGHSLNPEELVYPLYKPEEAASPMRCTEQFQFCNPSLSKSRCGPLASWSDSITQSAPLFGMTSADFVNGSEANGTMASRYQWLILAIAELALTTIRVVATLGSDSLVSLKYLANGIVGSLQDDQWQLDVEYWWAITLAYIQPALVDTARGSTDPVLKPYKVLPYNSDVWAMCKNQKIRSTRHVSFSLFGLYFTFVTGLLIIIISFTLEPIFKCLYRRRKYKQHIYLEWAASKTLQLQRIGFQGVNAGSWCGKTDAIPTTKPGEILLSLTREYSSDTESTIAAGRTPEEASDSSAAASSRASWNQEADMVSLDSLLDASANFTVGSPVTQAGGNPNQIDHTS